MRTNKFKLTFDDGSFGVYGLKASRKEIKELYPIGKRMCLGDRCDGTSMIGVYKNITDVQFVTKKQIVNSKEVWS